MQARVVQVGNSVLEVKQANPANVIGTDANSNCCTSVQSCCGAGFNLANCWNATKKFADDCFFGFLECGAGAIAAPFQCFGCK